MLLRSMTRAWRSWYRDMMNLLAMLSVGKEVCRGVLWLLWGILRKGQPNYRFSQIILISGRARNRMRKAFHCHEPVVCTASRNTVIFGQIDSFNCSLLIVIRSLKTCVTVNGFALLLLFSSALINNASKESGVYGSDVIAGWSRLCMFWRLFNRHK